MNPNTSPIEEQKIKDMNELVHEVMTKAYNMGVEHCIAIIELHEKENWQERMEVAAPELISQLQELKKP